MAPHAMAEILRMAAYSDKDTSFDFFGLDGADEVKLLSSVEDLDTLKRLAHSRESQFMLISSKSLSTFRAACSLCH